MVCFFENSCLTAFFSALAFLQLQFFFFNSHHSFYLIVCHYQLCSHSRNFVFVSVILYRLSLSLFLSFTLSNEIPLNSPIIYSPMHSFHPSYPNTQIQGLFILDGFFFYRVFCFYSTASFFFSYKRSLLVCMFPRPNF